MTIKHSLGGLLFCVMAAAFAQTPAISDNEVRIGVLTDMGSLFSDVTGAGSVLMAQMAIDDFNAAEKPVFKVKLLSADMQLKPDVASTIARSWFDQDGVDMITDVPMSAATLAVMKLAEDKNRLLIATGAASTRITGEECSANTLHWVYDSYSQTYVTASALTRGGATSWFIVAMDSLGTKAYADDFTAGVTSAGGKVLGRVLHPPGAPDYSSYVLQAQASGAQAIGLATQTVDVTSFLKLAGEFGLIGKQQMVTAILHASDVHTTGLDITKGINVVDAFYWDRNADTRALSKRFFDKRNKMPTFAQAGVYSAVYQYLKAVKLAGTDEAKAVVRQLKAMPIDDAVFKQGKVRADGKMVHDMLLLEVKQPGESKAPWDYMKIKAVIPAERAFQPLAVSKCRLLGTNWKEIDLQQRTAIVTGAAGTIGQGTVTHLLKQGRRVVLVDKAQDKLAEVAARFSSDGEVLAVAVDLAEDGAPAAVAAAIDRHGWQAAAILINNAAISFKRNGVADDVVSVSAHEWDTMIRVNLTAPMLLAKMVLPAMTAKRWGRIVNISSRAGRYNPNQSGPAYAVTKAALLGLTRSIANDFSKHGVTCNSIAPGYVVSALSAQISEELRRALVERTPVGRGGTPDELGSAIAYLASEDAGFISGACLDVNGGQTMS